MAVATRFAQEDIPGKFADAVKDLLAPWEPVKWVGQPPVGAYVSRKLTPFLYGAFVLLIGIATGVLLVASDALEEDGWAIALTAGWIFWGIVSVALMTTPLYHMVRARNTLYLITDRRALIVVIAPTPSVREFGPESLKKLLAEPAIDGSGDLIFDYRFPGPLDSALYLNEWDQGKEPRPRIREEGFVRVPDVRRVEAIAREIAAPSRKQS